MGMAGLLHACNPLRGLGAKWQPVRGAAPRDHLPINLNMIMNKGGPVLPQEERTRWDQDRMMEALRT
eukprot:6797367-Pyramimonas_sp.AAC.1